MSTQSSLIRQVRQALTHLYDPDILRRHPLNKVLGTDARVDCHSALREAIVAIVESLRPGPSVPVGSRAWRVYNVLKCRYLQQLDQKQTAHQLSVSIRHLRREQAAAVRTVADLIARRYEIQHPDRVVGPNEGLALLEAELSWLKDPDEDTFAVLSPALHTSLHLLTPVAAHHNVRLALESLPLLPPVAVHPMALQQIILSAAAHAIRRIPGGDLRLSVHQRGQEVVIRMVATSPETLESTSDEDRSSFEATCKIVGMCAGHIYRVEEGRCISVTVTIPTAGFVNVLLIDDNDDLAELLVRFGAGTRYHIDRASSPDALFELIAERNPQIVLLDIMMPSMDGWQILGRLKQHPLSSELPIIVCSVLPERELALVLGASAFLPKPVTRSALLATFREVFDRRSRESHQAPAHTAAGQALKNHPCA